MKCLHQLFQNQAARTPARVALQFGSSFISFQDINERSNQIARYLRKMGIENGSRVAINMERSPDLISSLLGVFKAGACYVPIGTNLPIDRAKYILEDSRPHLLMSTSKSIKEIFNGSLLDVTSKHIDLENKHDLHNVNVEDDPLYIMYTSGSTGAPKGVIGHHKGMINRFQWMWEKYPFSSGEVCCQKTTIGFVDSVWEMFGPLLKGIPVIIIPQNIVIDTEKLLKTIQDNNVSRIVLVPSLLDTILDHISKTQKSFQTSLKLVTVSGEALSLETVKRFKEIMPSAKLLNLYGSTEVSADITYFEAHTLGNNATSVPVGLPISNTYIHILDEEMRRVPKGGKGELYVSGMGVGHGYFNKPELTNERFIKTPSGEILFKMGDIVRLDDNNLIEYLGRTDFQVKIRGNRIELGEVESAIQSSDVVEKVIVHVVNKGQPNARLVAYILPKSEIIDKHHAVKELRLYASKTLPAYMCPANFVFLDAIPLTTSGKVNRLALPLPSSESLRDYDTYLAPRNAIEHKVAGIFEDLLKYEPVGITDNFFYVGGDSLSAAGLLSALDKEFGISIPIDKFIEQPTVLNVSKILKEASISEFQNTIFTLKKEGDKSPLFLIHPIIGLSFCYTTLAYHTADTRPIYGVNNPSIGKKEEKFNSIEAMAQHYVIAIKEKQKTGPYYVGGWSFGGNVAYEIARQLESAGDKVGALILIDAYNTKVPESELDVLSKMQLVRTSKYLESQGLNPSSPEGNFYLDEAINNLHICNSYNPLPFSGNVLLLKASLINPDKSIDIGPVQPLNGWGSVIKSKIKVIKIPGEHGELMQRGNVEHIARVIDSYLDVSIHAQKGKSREEL
jgi:amino acid adenylation domain-containing protein